MSACLVFPPDQGPEASHQLLYGRQTRVRPHVVPLTPLWLLLRTTSSNSAVQSATAVVSRLHQWDAEETPNVPTVFTNCDPGMC